MADTTKNYGLVKPSPEDFYDVRVFNENMEKIDKALEDVSPDYVIEQNNQNEQKFWVGTKEEFDAIPVKDPNTSYTVTDEDDTVPNINDLDGIVEIEKGGTGATSVAQARENLGVYSKEYVDALAKPVLLWENTDNFYASGYEQKGLTTQLGDVSAYSEYIVQTVNHGQFRSKVGRYIHMPYTNISETHVSFFNRGVVLLTSGELNIRNCFGWTKNDSGPMERNNQLIVEAVYGVKGD